jgi:hypothetical protein
MKKIIIAIIILILIADIKTLAQTYNPEKAAQYAQRWCNGRNTNPADADEWGGPYIDYDNYGGDCAAFVSQCLIYGGLSLSKGTNGNGNGVKSDKVISGASNLVLHLSGYQNTSIYVSETGFKPPTDHDVGDPMFMASGSTGIEASHSLFCISLDWVAKQLYSTHTTDYCNDDWPTNLHAGRLIFFHIKSSVPDHCSDCEKNFDEEEMDCGGEDCPPCDHAPNKVILNTPTSNLPSDVRAIAEITAGNAAVKVLSGQNVTFTTAGTINLLPGFEVQAGGNFSSVAKGGILGVTAACDEYCNPPLWTSWSYIRHQDQFYVEPVANAEKIYYEIYRSLYSDGSGVYDWIFEETVNVIRDGRVYLWDLISGEEHPTCLKGNYCWYAIKLWVFTCKEKWVRYQPYTFIVNNVKGKSSNNEPEETENLETLLFQNLNNIPPQEETSSPTLTIIPNPNPGAFQLETNFLLSDIGNLKITNLLGVTVYESKNPASNTIQLPASISGQHFVVVNLKDGTVLTQKMMIQR